MNVTPESVKALLDDEDFSLRMRGVNQLRELDPALAFELIQPLITDRHVRVRYAAVSQLSSLGTQDRQRSLTLLRDRLNSDPENDVRAAAADSLGALHLTEAFEDLQTQFNNTQEWLLQFSITAALGELGDPRGFELLEIALQSQNELVRTAAIGAFGELGDTRAIALLAPFTHDSDWQVRYRVAQSLGRMKQDPEAQNLLQGMIQDEMEPVAQEAQHSLA